MMAEALVRPEREIASAATDLATGVLQQVREAEKLVKELGTEGYLSSGHRLISTGSGWSLIPVYAECFIRSGAKTRKELEQIWRDHMSSDAVQASVESVLNAEREIDKFVEKVGAVLEQVEDRNACPSVSVVGSQLPSDLHFTEARSGESVTLESYWKQSPFTHLVLIRQFA